MQLYNTKLLYNCHGFDKFVLPKQFFIGFHKLIEGIEKTRKTSPQQIKISWKPSNRSSYSFDL